MAIFMFNGKEYKTSTAMFSAQRGWITKNIENTAQRAADYYPHLDASNAQIERHYNSTVKKKVSKSIPNLGRYEEDFHQSVLKEIFNIRSLRKQTQSEFKKYVLEKQITITLSWDI